MTTFQDLGNSNTIRTAVVVTLGLLSLFLLAITINAFQDLGHSNTPYTNTITVTGEGKSTAVPNIASVSYTVMESASTVAAAQDAASKKGNAALEFLKQQGIEDKDVQSSGYNVYPKYEYTPCVAGAICNQTQRIVGYEVSSSISVKVRDTDKAGAVLQGLGNLGVQNISGPNFTVDDASAVQAEARGKAIADAREKADMLAKQLGVRIGTVVSFSEGGNYPMYASYAKGGATMDMAVAQSAAPMLPTGENETNVTVSITYEIH